MNQMAKDLRAAAASARAFAETIDSPELGQSFRAMARRWEAEAETCEKRPRRYQSSEHILASKKVKHE